jgi:hypothetical protein
LPRYIDYAGAYRLLRASISNKEISVHNKAKAQAGRRGSGDGEGGQKS